MAQVVGAELELEAVPGQGAGRGHDAGVVDQQIKAAVTLGQGVGGGGDTGQIGQIQAEAIEGTVRTGRALLGQVGQELGPGRRRLLGRAAGQHHSGPVGRQGASCFQTQPAVGPGHQGQATALVRNRRSGPGTGAGWDRGDRNGGVHGA